MFSGKEARIGIVGSGFIARGLSLALNRDPILSVSRVLTRRDLQTVSDFPLKNGRMTNSVAELVDYSDLVVECSGDPVHGTEVLSQVLNAGLPVVTMNSELQIVSGSWLQRKGLITEAEGDQPGSLAALNRDILAMGFVPVVFGNIKGFLNQNPTREEMEYWAKKGGISLQQVTSFTDGTNIQIEQALVANGLGGDIAQRGLLGIECEDYRVGAVVLAEKAEPERLKISDYVLSPKSPAGVFIVARHNNEQGPFLKYYKLGDGPFYILTRPFHLCHLEIPKTIRQVLAGDGILLNNGSSPKISVAAIAKRELGRHEIIERGIGGFAVRGEAVQIGDYPTHVPIGLMAKIILRHCVEPGQMITFDDVEMPESTALRAWQETMKK